MVDALEARSLEILELEADARVGLVQLLDAAAHGPLRLEFVDGPRQQVAVDTVAAQVRAGPLGEADLAAGHHAVDDLGHLADAVVLGGGADVEGPAMHERAVGLQQGDVGAGDVLDMHQRPPGRAVALEVHLAGREGPRGQVVDHQVEADARRQPVRGRGAQEHGAEVVASQEGHVALDLDLRHAVGRHRVEGRVLVQEVLAAAAVVAAGAGEQEALHARLLGQLRQAHRTQVVDAVGQRRVVIAQRIVRQPRQVDDRIEALQDVAVDIAHVADDLGHLRQFAVEGAGAEQVGVQARDLVAALHEHGHKHAADVALVSGQEDFHVPRSRPMIPSCRSIAVRRSLAANPSTSTARGPNPTSSAGCASRAMCPCTARTTRACRPSTGRRGPGPPSAPARTSSGHPRCSP